MSSSLFLIKLFQHLCFPVNITKFLKTPILKNNLQTAASEYRLQQQGRATFARQIRWNVVRYGCVLCLFVWFWYYYICILLRSSRTEAFFKRFFLKALWQIWDILQGVSSLRVHNQNFSFIWQVIFELG